jgi:hypothetical protein
MEKKPEEMPLPALLGLSFLETLVYNKPETDWNKARSL